MIICLDTSFIVKLLTKEEASETAEQFFTQWIQDERLLITPFFARYEIWSTLRKKNFRGHLTNKELENTLQDLSVLKVNFIPDITLLPRALQLATQLNLSVIYDCLFLVLAEKENGILWTCDKKFYLNAKNKYAPIEYIGS